jgi:XTP/dITP diphosphohydrolase
VEVPARIVLASANPKKVAELASILTELDVRTPSGEPVELLPRPDHVPEVVEDAPDFVGNARLKAVALADATGEVALADDSGLVVDALDGAPGVRSARYAGEEASEADNVDLLLRELSEAEGRSARFVCVLVLRAPDGAELVVDGTVEGMITSAPAGGGGFGYDPVFVPAEGDGRTFAQMGPAEKSAISHRGRALRTLAAALTS